MFEDIAWSTECVAEQTLERAREIALDVHRLPVWYDVDDMAGLSRLHGELSGEDMARRTSGAYPPHYAVQTAKLMHRLWRDHDFGRRAEHAAQGAEARA
jgi:hypothetical protein